MDRMRFSAETVRIAGFFQRDTRAVYLEQTQPRYNHENIS